MNIKNMKQSHLIQISYKHKTQSFLEEMSYKHKHSSFKATLNMQKSLRNRTVVNRMFSTNTTVSTGNKQKSHAIQNHLEIIN